MFFLDMLFEGCKISKWSLITPMNRFFVNNSDKQIKMFFLITLNMDFRAADNMHLEFVLMKSIYDAFYHTAQIDS